MKLKLTGIVLFIMMTFIFACGSECMISFDSTSPDYVKILAHDGSLEGPIVGEVDIPPYGAAGMIMRKPCDCQRIILEFEFRQEKYGNITKISVRLAHCGQEWDITHSED